MTGTSTVLAILCLVLGGTILLSAAIVWLSTRINPQGIEQ